MSRVCLSGPGFWFSSQFLCHVTLKLAVSRNVHPSTKSLFDFIEIRYVGGGRQVMHDGMPYDLIHGQGQGHEPFNGNPAIFKNYLLCHLEWQLATDHGFLN